QAPKRKRRARRPEGSKKTGASEGARPAMPHSCRDRKRAPPARDRPERRFSSRGVQWPVFEAVVVAVVVDEEGAALVVVVDAAVLLLVSVDALVVVAADVSAVV